MRISRYGSSRVLYVQEGDESAVLLLLQLRDCLVLLRHADVDGNLPLHVACQNSHSAIVKALLQEDSSIIESSNKYVPRHCPACMCYVTAQQYVVL